MFTADVILFKLWKIVKVELYSETCTFETMLNLNSVVLVPVYYIQLTFLKHYNKLEVKSGKVFLPFLISVLFCLTFQILESTGLIASWILGEGNRVYALYSIVIKFSINV